MKRVVVIGSGGAGKSTFARRLGDATGLPVIHLDSLFWRPNWVATPREEWAETIAELVSGDRWIMDGNFGGTREMRVRASDTIILLDVPRLKCMYRVIKRAIVYRGRSRPDMAEGCKEKIDREFAEWVWNFPKHSRGRIIEEIIGFPEKRFVILRSGREIDSFIEEAEKSTAR